MYTEWNAYIKVRFESSTRSYRTYFLLLYYHFLGVLGLSLTLNTNGFETRNMLGSIVARVPKTSSDIPWKIRETETTLLIDDNWFFFFSIFVKLAFVCALSIIPRCRYLRNEKLQILQFRSTPRCHFYHKTFDTLEHQFCSFGTPRHCHVLRKNCIVCYLLLFVCSKNGRFIILRSLRIFHG